MKVASENFEATFICCDFPLYLNFGDFLASSDELSHFKLLLPAAWNQTSIADTVAVTVNVASEISESILNDVCMVSEISETIR